MTTDHRDLVFDPTCGSGTTAYVAEQCGRRWITCDTQPLVNRRKVRITGPFTVEVVPVPAVKSADEILEPKPEPPGLSIARSSETLRQVE